MYPLAYWIFKGRYLVNDTFSDHTLLLFFSYFWMFYRLQQFIFENLKKTFSLRVHFWWSDDGHAHFPKNCHHGFLFIKIIPESHFNQKIASKKSLHTSDIAPHTRGCSAKIFGYVFFKIANLQCIQLYLCSKSMESTCERVQI